MMFIRVFAHIAVKEIEMEVVIVVQQAILLAVGVKDQ
jgi:hypothetical protein